MLDTNIEVHFFRGDPGKGHAPWMYSIRDSHGYRLGDSGAENLVVAALGAVLDILGEEAFGAELHDFLGTYIGASKWRSLLKKLSMS